MMYVNVFLSPAYRTSRIEFQVRSPNGTPTTGARNTAKGGEDAEKIFQPVHIIL